MYEAIPIHILYILYYRHTTHNIRHRHLSDIDLMLEEIHLDEVEVEGVWLAQVDLRVEGGGAPLEWLQVVVGWSVFRSSVSLKSNEDIISMQSNI